MRFMTATIAMLLAAAAAPALAAENATFAPPLQLTDAGDFASQKAEYEARARQEIERWQNRMSEIGAKAQENGKRLTQNARDELDRAWAATKEQWASLQQAGVETWDRTRIAFERATDTFREEWRKDAPDDQRASDQ